MVFEQAVLTLNLAGLDPSLQKDGSPSEVAVYLERCRRENGVDLTGRFAGYDRGLHELGDWRVLATKGFKLIEPKQDPDGSRCPHIRAIVDGLFGAKQKDFFEAKLKCDIEAHRAGIRSGGMALVVVGPTDIGKTLLLKVIVPLLGGRAADAYDFLAGKTAFNSELMGTEVHYIDDSNPFTDREARRQFANMIKKAVAAAGVYCHKKGKDGVTLPLYRRVFIFLNHDSLDAMPEMEDSLMDKVMMLQAEKFKMPQGCLLLPSMAEPEKYVHFVKVLEQELPYYLSHLLHLQVRDELKERRFGVRAFKHPALLRKLKELSPDDEVHYLVQQTLFRETHRDEIDGDSDYPPEQVRIETNALLTRMLDQGILGSQGGVRDRARTLFRNARALGTALGRLSHDKQYRRYYKGNRSDGKSYWTITRSDREEEGEHEGRMSKRSASRCTRTPILRS